MLDQEMKEGGRLEWGGNLDQALDQELLLERHVILVQPVDRYCAHACKHSRAEPMPREVPRQGLVLCDCNSNMACPWLMAPRISLRRRHPGRALSIWRQTGCIGHQRTEMPVMAWKIWDCACV